MKFEEAGLHPVMVENIKLCGYKIPTPIQAYSIPAILTGKDLIAVAQTGMSTMCSKPHFESGLKPHIQARARLLPF